MKTGRNDLCPCGSGLKYKRCCQTQPSAAAAPSPVPSREIAKKPEIAALGLPP